MEDDPAAKRAEGPGAKQWIESAGQMLVVAGATTYGIGLIIENLYLTARGVSPGGLLRSDYVLAGLLWLFLVSVGLIVVDAVTNGFRLAIKAARYRRWWAVALAAIFTAFALYFTPFFFLTFLFVRKVRYDDTLFFITYACVGGAAIGLSWFVAPVRKAIATGEAPKWPDDADISVAAMAVLSLLMFLASYATYVYPHLKPALGGGHREQSYLVLSADAPAAITTMLPRSRSRPGLAGPVEVVLESDSRILVVPTPWQDDARAVSLSKDTVKAIFPVGP